jgi:Kelch motif
LGRKFPRPWNSKRAPWSPTGALPVEVFLHAATLLPNGAVLATGGSVEPACCSTAAEIYDPRNGTWTATGNLNVGRRYHTSILLRKGKVLIVAGEMFPDSGSTELGSRVQQ